MTRPFDLGEALNTASIWGKVIVCCGAGVVVYAFLAFAHVVPWLNKIFS